jgi:hypothetical protein
VQRVPRLGGDRIVHAVGGEDEPDAVPLGAAAFGPAAGGELLRADPHHDRGKFRHARIVISARTTSAEQGWALLVSGEVLRDLRRDEGLRPLLQRGARPRAARHGRARPRGEPGRREDRVLGGGGLSRAGERAPQAHARRCRAGDAPRGGVRPRRARRGSRLPAARHSRRDHAAPPDAADHGAKSSPLGGPAPSSQHHRLTLCEESDVAQTALARSSVHATRTRRPLEIDQAGPPFSRTRDPRRPQLQAFRDRDGAADQGTIHLCSCRTTAGE